MEHDVVSKLINSLRDNHNLATFRKNLLSRAAVTIGKVLNRHKGDPDYVIGGDGWDMWVDCDKVAVRHERYSWRRTRDYLNTDKEGLITLNDLLGSRGSGTVAMLYIKELDKWHHHYQVRDFPDLSIGGMGKYLVHFILYEPRKIKWVDHLPLSCGRVVDLDKNNFSKN